MIDKIRGYMNAELKTAEEYLQHASGKYAKLFRTMADDELEHAKALSVVLEEIQQGGENESI